MTIAVRPLVAVVAIAIAGILVGLGIGNITQADSTPAASASSAETRLLRQISAEIDIANRRLGKIYGSIGATSFEPGGIRGLLRKVCAAAQGRGGDVYGC